MTLSSEPAEAGRMFDRLGLAFPDATLEKRFVDEFVGGSIRISQVFLVIGGVAFYIFFICDLIMDPVGGQVSHMIRGLAVSPIFLGAAALLYTPFGKRYHEVIAVGAYMWGQIGSILVYREINHGFDFAAMAFVLLLMGTNAAFALRAKYIVLVAIFALISTLMGHILVDNARPRWIIINILAVATAIVFSSISAYLRERAARRQFLTDVALNASRARVDDLLHAMLPRYIVQRIQSGETGIADSLGEVSVIFANVGNVADPTQDLNEAQLVRGLNRLFSDFDREAERYGIDKIKTIGGSYMAIGGLAVGNDGSDHLEKAAEFTLSIQAIVQKMIDDTGYPINLRIGMHVGPVVAGVLGVQRPVFDCWGESVNLASRLESHAPVCGILISESTYWRLKRQYYVPFFADLKLKGIGRTKTYLLSGRLPEDSPLRQRDRGEQLAVGSFG
jgi:adenylate cyclase